MGSRRRWWIACLLLAGCRSGEVNLEWTVFPDGSGRFAYYASLPQEPKEGGSADPEGLLRNAKEPLSATSRLVVLHAGFESIDAFAVGDMTFAFAPGEKSSRLRITIPTSPDARWWRSLGWGDREVENFRRSRDLLNRRGGISESDPTNLGTVVLAVAMPGEVLDHKLVEPDPAPAWKLETEPGVELCPSPRGHKVALLYIPIQDILQGKHKKVVWEIRSGPGTAEMNREWQRIRGTALGLAYSMRHEDLVDCLDLSRDEKTLVAGSRDGIVRLWDLKEGRPLLSIETGWESVWRVALSPDGTSVATSYDENPVRIWSAKDGKLVREMREGSRSSVSLAFSSDGRVLLSGGERGGLRAFDLQTGNQTYGFECDGQFRLSADGTSGVCARNTRLVVFRPSDGTELRTFDTGRDIGTPRFSPDGRRIAAFDSSRLRVWDAASGKETHSFEGNGYDYPYLAFTPDGDSLAFDGPERDLCVVDLRKKNPTPQPLAVHRRVHDARWAGSETLITVYRNWILVWKQKR